MTCQITTADIQFLIEQFAEYPSFNNSGFSGVISVTEQNQQRIVKFIEAEYFSTDDDILLDSKVGLSFNANYLHEITPRIAVSYQHYHRFYSKNKFDSDTPIIEEMAEQHFRKLSYFRKSIQSVVELTSILKTNFYANENAIILFSGEALEIKIPEWESFSWGLTEESRQAINDFIDWIDTGDSDNSDKNKRRKEVVASILSKELYDTPAANRLEDLITRLPQLSVECKKSYDLYLEEFTYSKFSKKLEESALGFYDKINNALSSLRTQVLSLPLLLGLIRFLKFGDDAFVRYSFIAYISVVLLVLVQHFVYLKNLEAEFLRFHDKHKNTLSEDMVVIKKTFDRQKLIQWVVYWALALITGGILYSVFCLGTFHVAPPPTINP